jgi:hypothetical protein
MNKVYYLTIYIKPPALDYTALASGSSRCSQAQYFRSSTIEGDDTHVEDGTQVVDGCTGFPVSRSAC